MTNVEELNKRLKEIKMELRSLGNSDIQKRIGLEKELEIIDAELWLDYVKKRFKEAKECGEDGGHLWVILKERDSFDKPGTREYFCMCVGCGKHYTDDVENFKDVIRIDLPETDDILLGTQFKLFFEDSYYELTKEKGMSKKQVIDFTNNNSKLFSEKFEKYYSKVSAPRKKVKRMNKKTNGYNI